MLELYCDGSSTGKSNSPCGWGFVIVKNQQIIDAGYGPILNGTNNTAEIAAATQGLRRILSRGWVNDELVVISDSLYVLGIIAGTQAIISNVKVATELRELAQKLKAKTRWVKGHGALKDASFDTLINHRCDKLAKQGKELATELLAAHTDENQRRLVMDNHWTKENLQSPEFSLEYAKVRRIVAHNESLKLERPEHVVVAFTGHRPAKLGGYKPHPLHEAIKAQVRFTLERLQPNAAISGMALGVDQWCAEICNELKIPWIAAIPFEGQEGAWPTGSIAAYKKLLETAATVKVVCEGDYEPYKMQARNQWMVNNCTVLIAVWDGTDGGTANCVRYAHKKNRKIIRIDPTKLVSAKTMARIASKNQQ